MGAELGMLLLEFGQIGPQAPDLAVDARQLGPGLLFADVHVAGPGPGEALALAAEQSQPRVPVYIGLPVLQRARVDRAVDLVLGQPELLAGGLVAQRCRLRPARAGPSGRAASNSSSTVALSAAARAAAAAPRSLPPVPPFPPCPPPPPFL